MREHTGPGTVVETWCNRTSDLPLANSRLTRCLLSLNTCAAQLTGLVFGWCCDRCRTFLEYMTMRVREPRQWRRPEQSGSWGDVSTLPSALRTLFLLHPAGVCVLEHDRSKPDANTRCRQGDEVVQQE